MMFVVLFFVLSEISLMIYFSSFWELQVGEILQFTQKRIEDMAQLLG